MSRKLKPCVLAGDLDIVPGQQLVMLWAHGSVARNSFSGVTYHGPGFKNKGSVGVTLLAEEVLSQRSALQAADQAADQHAPVASSEAPEPLPVTDAHVEAIVRKFMHARDASADNARRGTAPAVCTSSKCDASAEQSVMHLLSKRGSSLLHTIRQLPLQLKHPSTRHRLSPKTLTAHSQLTLNARGLPYQRK